MKKLSAILLICTFVLLQANRWTAYMSCRLQSLYTSATCDCERILSSPNDAPADHHGNTAYVHWHPDDFFHPSKGIDIQVPATTIKHLEGPAAKGLAGHPFSLYKPPVV